MTRCNHTENLNLIYLPDDFWKFFFEATQAIGSIATAIALGFVGWQTYLTKKQLSLEQEKTNRVQEESNITFRPWIGFTSVNQEDDKLLYKIKNYGRLPAMVIGLYSYVGANKIMDDELEKKEIRMVNKFTVFPDHEETINIKITKELESVDFNFALVIKFKYLKAGEGKSSAIGFLQDHRFHLFWTHAE